jgi:small subunit ribosomal protein S1
MSGRATETAEQARIFEVAVNDIGSEADFLAAIDETIKYFNDGDIVSGTIVKVDRDEVLLDLGYKSLGVIPARELSIKEDVDPNEVVSVGDDIEAFILQQEDKEGRLILSKKRAQYERAWSAIEKIQETDGIVTGTVIEVVKGGLILDIGLRGFLPASLVAMRRVRDLQPYVGKQIEAKIIELNKNRNNVVLSRRAWLEQTHSEVRETFLQTLQTGQIRSGVVSSVVNFGAFVDLGGVDGLIHVSELSWKNIDHPAEVVEVGQEVTVEVLAIDLERERVSLSMKATQEEPWQQFARTHAIGEVVPGKVTKLVPLGAFVRVDENIEGLVVSSELTEGGEETSEQVVQVDDLIFVKVVDIDPERHRIQLSLRQASKNEPLKSLESSDPTPAGEQLSPWGRFLINHAVGENLSAEVVSIGPICVAVHIDEVDGLLPITEVWRTANTAKPLDLLPGDNINVTLLDLDAERMSISLGMQDASRLPESNRFEVDGFYAGLLFDVRQAWAAPEVEARSADSSVSLFNRKLQAAYAVLETAELVWHPAVVRSWLQSANSFLGGAKPGDVLVVQGAGEVLEALNAAAGVGA